MCEVVFESGLYVYQFSIEPWIRGDFEARMGHQIAFNLAKTGRNMFSQSLQFRVLFIRDFESAIQDLLTTVKPIIMLVWVTPISNQEH